MDQYGLRIGTQINIKRSDGRVHGAVVSGVNDSAMTVTVEWFENEETKGKELDIKTVLASNPELGPKSRVADRAPVAHVPTYVEKAGKPQEAPASVAKPRPVTSTTPSKQKAAAAAPLKAPSSSNVSVAPASTPSPAPASVSKPPPPNNAAAAANPAKKAPSKTLQEIQKLEKQREERRAKAHEKAEKKEQRGGKDNVNQDFMQMIDEFRDNMDIHTLDPNGPVSNQKITVCVRKRPLNKKELANFDYDVVTVPAGSEIVVHEPKTKVDLSKYLDNHDFRFDHVFDDDITNATIYRFTAAPLVRTIFEGGFATCFAYGQTGSGKTFTMGGDFTEGGHSSSPGIYHYAIADVFKLNNSAEHKSKGLSVSISFFEIYGVKVFDLLSKNQKLRILEDGNGIVQIVGLSEAVVTSAEEVNRFVQQGSLSRAQGTTSANQCSSRSHAVFQIILRSNKGKKLHGKFSLIDLAGNERGADTANADRQTRMEGAEINKSLLALKECIRALGRKNAHCPFRASKLTQVLRDSFVAANARTCMIAMISPGIYSCENSLNTLRYADRVKELGPSRAPEGDEAEVYEGDVGIENESFPEIDAHGMSDELSESLAKQDLKMLHQTLRTRGENMEEQLLDFQQIASEVMEAEEKLIEEHKAVVASDRAFLAEEEKIIKAVDFSDYDAEVYARRLEEIVAAKIDKLTKLKASLAQFKTQLSREEQASKAVQKGRGSK